MKVLITGGSSGIGLEIAKLFAKDGYELIIVAKPLMELEKAKNMLLNLYPTLVIHTKVMDLSNTDNSREIFNWVKNSFGQIDVVVNNAGMGTYGFLQNTDLKKELEMIDLHIKNTYLLTRLFLVEMMKVNKGNIINIASVTSFQPNPLMSTYGATKSFIYNFSRAVNYELKKQGSNVRITTVCPTTAKTNFQKSANMEASTIFDSWLTIKPEKIAQSTYRAMKRGRAFVIPGWFYHGLHSIIKRVPEPLVIWYTYRQLRPSNIIK